MILFLTKLSNLIILLTYESDKSILVIKQNLLQQPELQSLDIKANP
jgi:hypothetical protein